MKNERGTALVEAAVTIPILLLIAVGIFEFGRAYQTWQVLTNAAREGTRYAVTPGSDPGNAASIVRTYMRNGGLTEADRANVTVQTVSNPAGVAGVGSIITVRYPFSFIVLQPVARLISPSSEAGAPLIMTATATMRNESP